MPADAVNNKYDFLSEYLTFWHYLIADLIHSLQLLCIIVCGLLVLSLVFCFAIVALPTFAFAFCHLLSFATFVASAAYLLRRALNAVGNGGGHVMGIGLNVGFFAILFSVTAACVLTFAQAVFVYRAVCAIFQESCSAVRAMPKLLSIGLANIFAAVFLLFFSAAAVTHTSACDRSATSYVLRACGLEFEHVAFYAAELAALSLYCPLVLSIVKTLQSAVVAGAVHAWYFSASRASVANPITRSVAAALRYNLPRVVCCSLSGRLPHLACRAIAHKRRQRHAPVTTGSGAVFDRAELFFAHLSPFSPCSVGMRGRVRPTLLCRYRQRWFIPKKPTDDVQRQKSALDKQQNRYEQLLCSNGLDRVILRCHSSVRRSLWLLQVALVVQSVMVLEFFLGLSGKRLRVYEAVAALLAAFAYFVCGLLFEVLAAAVDAVVLCLVDDLRANSGFTRPYYSSRGLLLPVTRWELDESATFSGAEEAALRLERSEAREEKQRQRLLADEKAKENAEERWRGEVPTPQ